MSATSNIIHDCDEVFNYWEPLHFLLFKLGFQTWEYSAQYALRSYLYIIFHALIGAPASWLFGEDKVSVFYAVRLFLGLLSVIADAFLVVALSRKYGKRLACYTLAVLCLSSGCFFASTSFLPSSFTMYAMSLASVFALLEKPAFAVAISAIGVIMGWPFSNLAFLPVTLFSLRQSFKRAFLSGTIVSLALLALSVLVDYHYYQRWTSSVLNLWLYNVLGGGESHLYGVEGPLFYLRNGFNNFNFCFVLALLFPVALLVQAVRKKSRKLLNNRYRFLYPIYLLICVAAAAFLESIPDFVRDKYNPYEDSIPVLIGKYVRPVILGFILSMSHARTLSLIHGYSAPSEIYKHLQYHEDAGEGSTLCVATEWHRFPSSFFIPDCVGQVRWIDDGFHGLLPFPFNLTLGGTSAAPSYFNNKNKASDDQCLRDLSQCTLLVELHLKRPFPCRGSDLEAWEIGFFFILLCYLAKTSSILFGKKLFRVVAALPYLDKELSPPLY